jgi:hypothetical protein
MHYTLLIPSVTPSEYLVWREIKVGDRSLPFAFIWGLRAGRTSDLFGSALTTGACSGYIIPRICKIRHSKEVLVECLKAFSTARDAEVPKPQPGVWCFIYQGCGA